MMFSGDDRMKQTPRKYRAYGTKEGARQAGGKKNPSEKMKKSFRCTGVWGQIGEEEGRGTQDQSEGRDEREGDRRESVLPSRRGGGRVNVKEPTLKWRFRECRMA